MNALTRDEAIAKLAKLRTHRRAIDAEIEQLARLIDRSKPQPKTRRRSRHVIPECGSESAYQRHRWYDEPKDDACLKAHARYTADQAKKRRDRRTQIVEAS